MCFKVILGTPGLKPGWAEKARSPWAEQTGCKFAHDLGGKRGEETSGKGNFSEKHGGVLEPQATGPSNWVKKRNSKTRPIAGKKANKMAAKM